MFTEFEKDIIGTYVDDKTGNKDDHSGNKAVIGEPGVLIIGKKTKIIPVEKSIERIVYQAETHDHSRHFFAICLQSERKNEVAVDIMQHPYQINNQTYRICGIVAAEKKE